MVVWFSTCVLLKIEVWFRCICISTANLGRILLKCIAKFQKVFRMITQNPRQFFYRTRDIILWKFLTQSLVNILQSSEQGGPLQFLKQNFILSFGCGFEGILRTIFISGNSFLEKSEEYYQIILDEIWTKSTKNVWCNSKIFFYKILDNILMGFRTFFKRMLGWTSSWA